MKDVGKTIKNTEMARKHNQRVLFMKDIMLKAKKKVMVIFYGLMGHISKEILKMEGDTD